MEPLKKKSNFPWGEQRAAIKDWYIKVVEIRLAKFPIWVLRSNKNDILFDS